MYAKVKFISYQIPIDTDNIIRCGSCLLQMLKPDQHWFRNPGLSSWTQSSIYGGRNDSRIHHQVFTFQRICPCQLLIGIWQQLVQVFVRVENNLCQGSLLLLAGWSFQLANCSIWQSNYVTPIIQKQVVVVVKYDRCSGCCVFVLLLIHSVCTVVVVGSCCCVGCWCIWGHWIGWGRQGREACLILACEWSCLGVNNWDGSHWKQKKIELSLLLFLWRSNKKYNMPYLVKVCLGEQKKLTFFMLTKRVEHFIMNTFVLVLTMMWKMN